MLLHDTPLATLPESAQETNSNSWFDAFTPLARDVQSTVIHLTPRLRHNFGSCHHPTHRVKLQFTPPSTLLSSFFVKTTTTTTTTTTIDRPTDRQRQRQRRKPTNEANEATEQSQTTRTKSNEANDDANEPTKSNDDGHSRSQPTQPHPHTVTLIKECVISRFTLLTRNTGNTCYADIQRYYICELP